MARGNILPPQFEYRRTPLIYSASNASSGDNTIIAAPGAKKRIVVEYISIQNTTVNATTALIKDGASTTIWSWATGTGGLLFQAPFNMTEELYLSENLALIVNLSGANAHLVNVLYRIEGL